MTDSPPTSAIPLHLHTLESLLRELISGRPVLLVKEHEVFQLKSNETRSILEWFVEDRNRWNGNASDEDVFAIVNAATTEPPEHPPVAAITKGGIAPAYRVKNVHIHHFAGIHDYSEKRDVSYNLGSGITVFEGKNGSGKTSLLNSVIWCLSGKILRSQQWPQPGDTTLEIKAGKGESEITAKSVAVSPLPPDSVVKAHANKYVPIDTWVKVTLTDPDGNEMPVLKRHIHTNAKGKLQHEEPDVSTLTLPPTSFETGTSMPGMLPLIEVGQKNDIGRAIAELTGFNDLRNLADRARRLRERMLGKMTKELNSEVSHLQAAFAETWQDLTDRLQNNPALMPEPADDYPFLKTGKANAEDLQRLQNHFETIECQAFEKAQDILGPEFDPSVATSRQELRQNANQALGLTNFTAISRLDSARRLGHLASLQEKERSNSEDLIATLFKEYTELAAIAATPLYAARERLYARVADWIREADEERRHLDFCATCDSRLEGKIDSVTGLPVRDHLQKRLDEPSDFLSYTLDAWCGHAEKYLSHELPDILRAEATLDLPNAPSDLMIQALTQELFSQPIFQRSLAPLSDKVKKLCDDSFATLPPFEEPTPLIFPGDFEAHFDDLASKLIRVNRALAFALWYETYATAWREAVQKVIGPEKSQEKTNGTSSLSGMLSALDTIVTNAEPIQHSLKNVEKLGETLSVITEKNFAIEKLALTANAIEDLQELGKLVDHQMDMLRAELHKETTILKDQIYLRPSGIAPRHAETLVSAEGSLDFSSETVGTRAPSQHVSNSSDMRATLFAFLIAFWKHVRDTHGGLDFLAFDDPQELFDRENQRRFSRALIQLTNEGAQLLISSYVPSFTDKLGSEARKFSGIEFSHRRISPITATRQFVGLGPMEGELEIKHSSFVKPAPGMEDSAAKNYVNELRIYIENRLSECFPERVPGLSENDTLGPYINHIRRLAAGQHKLFATPPFQKLIADQVFADNSDVREILNRSHHKEADTITHNEVTDIKDGLKKAKQLVETAYMEFELFQMGEAAHESGNRPTLTVPEPIALIPPEIKVDIILDLAAFTSATVETDSQIDETPLTNDIFNEKALYYLNTHNFGFAAPRGCIVIVTAESGPVEDGRLVLARYDDTILAGRLLRDMSRPGLLALGSETENPLRRRPSRFLYEESAALHKVTGILFSNTPPPDLQRRSIGDAAPIENFPTLNIDLAFKVRDDSAVPVALPGQIVLGGKVLTPEELKSGEGLLVAVSTSDGQKVFKRIGSPAFPNRKDIRLFESIGGKGGSLALGLEKSTQDELPYVVCARIILGIIYLP